MVVVEIGEIGRKYHIPKALLTEHSEFFKKALNGPWTESQEGVVRIDDISWSICQSSPCTEALVLIWSVEIFLDWLYMSKLPYTNAQWREMRDENHEDDGREDTMINAIALAHRLLAPKFRKAVEYGMIKEFVDYANTPWANTVVSAFEKLPSSSPILRLFVDAYCFNYDEEWHTEWKEDWLDLPDLPHDFLLRVVFRHSEMKKKPSSGPPVACDYHNHGSGDEREACKVVMEAQTTLQMYDG
jgi:hypothetical protein